MKQITSRTVVSDSIFNNEYEYLYGSLRNEKVTFTFINDVTGRETDRKMTYAQAFNLSMRRTRDKRYKNYSYAISV